MCLEKIMTNLLSLNKLSRGNYTEWLAARWLINLIQVRGRERERGGGEGEKRVLIVWI